MKVIDISYDFRIKGACATVTVDYNWFLEATTGAEENLNIQRAIIKDSRSYQTLRADLQRGCILPPIVLAISSAELPSQVTAESIATPTGYQGLKAQVEAVLAAISPTKVFIIDGLQRTNALRQTRDELSPVPDAKNEFLARPLRVEVWINIAFGPIAYRMLLLNAGQKPMSIKHQVEVLSQKLGDDLEGIPGIEIKNSLGAERRTRARQFVLAKLAQAFQAWLQGSPNIDLRNLVMDQLLAESAIETLGNSISNENLHDDFKSLVTWLADMDQNVWELDPQFFANETVLLGISAAVGAAQRKHNLRDRVKKSLDLLKENSHGPEDYLGVRRFNELRQAADRRKVNIGQFSRDLVFRTFQEFFLSDGEKPMSECWLFAAVSLGQDS